MQTVNAIACNPLLGGKLAMLATTEIELTVVWLLYTVQGLLFVQLQQRVTNIYLKPTTPPVLSISTAPFALLHIKLYNTCMQCTIA